MKLTKKKAIKLHRELWDWIYHHPSKRKKDWPRWKANGGDLPSVYNLCFFCESKYNCCLVDWVKTFSCTSPESFYRSYCNAKSIKTKKKYAKIIRDLPESRA